VKKRSALCVAVLWKTWKNVVIVIINAENTLTPRRLLKMGFFTKHLRDVDEGYFEHGKVATLLSCKLLVSSIDQLLHAVLPFVKPPFGTDVCSLVEHLESKKPENRAKCKED
jgi:hypothetical protein